MPGTVLVLVGPEYEDLEVWYPKLRLEEAGFEAPLGGLGDPSYRGKHGYPCTVDGHAKEWRAEELVGVVAPGGWAPDKIRRDKDVLSLVRDVHEAGGLIATICHGPWILISAGIVRGRRLTSTVGIRDDLVNAGATWCNEPVVVDGNIISSRVPADVASVDAILKALYDVISGAAGQKRDWNRMRSLFVPHARLMPAVQRPTGGAGVAVLSVDDYVTRAGPGLETNGFFEREIHRTVEQYGNILHAFSTYESRRTADLNEKPFARGINSIQLLKDGDRWWVVSIFWDSERAGNEIPAKYLPK